jgi:hypothetical protein
LAVCWDLSQVNWHPGSLISNELSHATSLEIERFYLMPKFQEMGAQIAGYLVRLSKCVMARHPAGQADEH